MSLYDRVFKPRTYTLSDGTAGGIEKGSVTFPLCQKHVDRWLLIPEDEIAATNAADEACQNETQYKNIVDLYLSLKENPENVDTDQLARQQNDKTLACLKKHGIVDDSVTADAYDELATMGESGGTSFDDLIGKYALKDNPAYDKRKAAIIEQCGAL